MAHSISGFNREVLLSKIDDSEVISFTQKLIQIPSVNGNEAEAAAFIAAACEQMGLKVIMREILPGRPNVIAILPGNSEEIGLAFHGHTDTVPFLGMLNPTSGEIADGYIWGRGSVDQKGGLAAAIQAVFTLAKAKVHFKKGLAILAVIDEESEHRGSFALVKEGFKANYAIVTEPTDLQLMVANKGTVPIKIEFTGVLAHGSNPWLGVNAIEMAAKTIMKLRNISPKSAEIPGIGTMQGTLNIGLIQGGTAYNNVPDSCSIWIDRRTVPGETQASVLAEIQQVLEHLTSEDYKFRAKAEVARPDWKWEAIRDRGLNPALTSPKSPVAQALTSAHKQATGKEVKLGYTNGYNDSDFLVNDLGIPTVNYGPGESARSHTLDEKLRIDHLLTAVRVYLLAALELLEEKEFSDVGEG